MRFGGWDRPLLSLLGLLAAYYAVPVSFEKTSVIVLGLIVTLAGLALLGLMLAREVRHLERGDSVRSTPVLAMAVAVVVISFSMSFYLLERLGDHQMVGLGTRTDALYFTLSTMATVGYGDVHAEGQLARGFVCGLIVFNVVVLTALFRGLANRRASS
ncbi:potassium channel family protein [Nocardioides sp.]|uniref:potassium channel family protein n=1 Tax=Nocardioides sp. TaxID=35761 RepID=UPI003D108B52